MRILWLLLLLCMLSACAGPSPVANPDPVQPEPSGPVEIRAAPAPIEKPAPVEKPASPPDPMPPVTSKEMLADGLDAELLALAKVMEQRYGDLTPREWGERVTGVITRIDTSDKVIALTFDACGASGLSAGYDRELIDFLTQEQIPATLFLSGQWIEANKQIARELAQNPLFVIENHGYRHRPLSVAGKNAYGIEGTGSIREVVAEIGLNDRLIKELTGRAPVYYRSGTAYYDEVAVMIARDMGKEVINFNVLGDAGATFSNAQIEKNLLGAKPGAIILYHMNRPESDTAAALIETLPKLQEQGFRFVHLREYHKHLK